MRNRLSWSAMDMYKSCPRSYYYSYIAKLRDPVIGSALIFGKALDEAINAMVQPKNEKWQDVYEKIISFQEINDVILDLKNSDLIKYSNTDFDFDILTDEDKEEIETILDQGSEHFQNIHERLIQLKRENNLFGEKLKHFNFMSYISLKRKGFLLLEAYKEQIVPLIKRVIGVQLPINLTNDQGDSFVGFIDLIVELHDSDICPTKYITNEQWSNIKGRIVLIDNKTSSQAYKQDSVKTSGQLATYFGSEEVTNLKNNVTHAGFAVMLKNIRKKKEPRVQVQFIVDQISEEFIDEIYKDYDKVNHLIHLGEFPRTSETCGNGFGCKYPEMCFGKGDKSVYIDRSLVIEAKK